MCVSIDYCTSLLHCQGTFLVSQAAARLMVESRVTNGSIINIASISGKVLATASETLLIAHNVSVCIQLTFLHLLCLP